MLDTREGMG